MGSSVIVHMTWQSRTSSEPERDDPGFVTHFWKHFSLAFCIVLVNPAARYASANVLA